jgi:ubiquinone/menaquinone biosynthesis C-methylase UbiE
MSLTSTLPRVLEAEVMDTAEEAADYDAMDHGEVNARFVTDLLAMSPDLSRTLDVGTGTARIPIELATRAKDANVAALDLADSMLAVARKNVEAAGLSDRIALVKGDSKGISAKEKTFSCVVSNSIIHHIPEPSHALSEMVRVLSPRGVLFVRDLARPEDDAAVASLVATYAKNDTPLQRKLFEDSLRAALTVSELQEIVKAFGIPETAVTMTSDRHWTLAWRR